jgi:sec-independent protein translocase protein TatB
MFDVGFWELLCIAILALLVLGPERLPGAIRSTLKTVRTVKQTANGFKNEVERQLQVHELHENLKKAEAKGLKDLSPELQESVDELKQAAESVQYPYKKKND